jgi:hypothetical protein
MPLRPNKEIEREARLGAADTPEQAITNFREIKSFGGHSGRVLGGPWTNTSSSCCSG